MGISRLNDIVHHLAYSSLSRDIVTVIVDGMVIMQDSIIKTLDVKDILSKCRERAARIHQGN